MVPTSGNYAEIRILREERRYRSTDCVRRVCYLRFPMTTTLRATAVQTRGVFRRRNSDDARKRARTLSVSPFANNRAALLFSRHAANNFSSNANLSEEKSYLCLEGPTRFGAPNSFHPYFVYFFSRREKLFNALESSTYTRSRFLENFFGTKEN